MTDSVGRYPVVPAQLRPSVRAITTSMPIPPSLAVTSSVPAAKIPCVATIVWSAVIPPLTPVVLRPVALRPAARLPLPRLRLLPPAVPPRLHRAVPRRRSASVSRLAVRPTSVSAVKTKFSVLAVCVRRCRSVVPIPTTIPAGTESSSLEPTPLLLLVRNSVLAIRLVSIVVSSTVR